MKVRHRSLVSQLYRTARLAKDLSVVASGNPHRMARRAKNKIVGRAMARGSSGGCCGAEDDEGRRPAGVVGRTGQGG
jgi:hypothetical protein